MIDLILFSKKLTAQISYSEKKSYIKLEYFYIQQ